MVYQFLSLAEVQGLYSLLMRDQGIVGELLDEGKLESATMRPQTRAYYEGGDLASLTAALIAGIALAHAYSDGNKRLSLLCGDSASFDFSPYYGQVGFFFIDGAHSYAYVRSDTLNALKCAHPGSVIAWHDFGRVGVNGVTKWLNELSKVHDIYSIPGSSVAFMVVT